MAENEDGQERTEDPTGKRREQAREEGRIPRSTELSSAAVMLAGAASLGMAGAGALGNFAVRVMRESAGALSAGELTPQGAATAIRGITLGFLLALSPFIAGVVAVTVLVNLLQSRGAISFAPLTPKLTNINLVSGFKRLFSMDAVVTLIKSVAKLSALGFVAWLVFKHNWAELISLAETGPAAVLVVMRELGVRLVLITGLAFLVVACADYAWQIVRHERSLRMTKQEVVMEHKEMEGNPQIKGRIRAMQRQRARQRMLQAVEKADVIVTNPTHIAVALLYDTEQSPAPLVVAMGERKLAERIKAIARSAGVPMVENKPVARALLATCVVGRPIPAALYAVVAEILAYVYRLRNPQYGRSAGTRGAA